MSDQQNERDNLPWTGKRTWEQKTEQTEVNDTTGEPEVKDPAEEHRLPQVNEMQAAQQSQEVAPDENQEPGDTVVETETVTERTEEKFYQPGSESEQGTDDAGDDSSEGSTES